MLAGNEQSKPISRKEVVTLGVKSSKQGLVCQQGFCQKLVPKVRWKFNISVNKTVQVKSRKKPQLHMSNLFKLIKHKTMDLKIIITKSLQHLQSIMF